MLSYAPVDGVSCSTTRSLRQFPSCAWPFASARPSERKRQLLSQSRKHAWTTWSATHTRVLHA